MKVSIIMSFYQSLDVGVSLEALLAQSYNNIEIFCIGDRVIDKSHDIVKQYAARYPEKIFFYLQDNRGTGSARNLGLSLARGEYIMFADAGDRVEPDIVQELINHIQETDSDFVCCAFDRVSRTGNIYSRELMANRSPTPFSITPDNVLNLAFIPPAPWAKLFKRSLIGDIRFPDDPILAYEDLIFFLLLCPKIKRYSILPKILYHYTVGEQSTMTNASMEKSFTFRKDLLALKEYFKHWGLSEQYNRLLDMVAFIHVGIADVHRIAENPTIHLSTFISDAKIFLDTNFPGWRRISCIQVGKFNIRKSLMYFLKVLLMSNVYIYMFVIRTYIFMIKKFHIDIKW